MGRRWVRRKKQKTATNSLVAGYGSSDDDDSDGEAAAPTSPWEKHVDAATGKPYWHDPATKRTTWDDPEPAPAPVPEPAPAPALEPAAAPAPPPALAPLLPVFRALESELDGISARTGKSPFALDAAARARLAVASSSTAEPVAVQAKALSEACLAARAACEGRDDLLGAVALGAVVARYADWHGGALSDDAFARRLRAMADALAPAADGEDAAPPPLPAGWAATWDAQQGCVYYYHESSGETSWARPT